MAGYSQNSFFKALADAQKWVCRVRFLCNLFEGPRHTANKTEKQQPPLSIGPVHFCF